MREWPNFGQAARNFQIRESQRTYFGQKPRVYGALQPFFLVMEKWAKKFKTDKKQLKNAEKRHRKCQKQLRNQAKKAEKAANISLKIC
ncbi:MAG: hypothetical protein IJ527_07805 [Prevotella sp.]|nr:hypothetical protein [Prevotella sp.]